MNDPTAAPSARLEIIEQSDRCSVVALAGDLDVRGVGEIDVRLLGATAARGRDTVIDLSELDFIASLGVGVLVQCAVALRRRNARLAIVCPESSDEIRSVLQRSRIDAIAAIAPDRAAARAAIGA